MKGFIKGAFIFVLGAGTGALGSAFFFMKRAEKACKEFEEQCRADYEELSAMNLAKEEYSSASLENSSGEKIEQKSEPVDYTKFSKPDANDVIRRAEERALKEEKPMEEDSPVVKLKGPRLIRSIEYGQNRTLEQEELYYYTDDDVLSNDNNEEISEDDVEYMLGDALTKFNFKTNDETVIFVRNEQIGCDYMITKIKGIYGNG